MAVVQAVCTGPALSAPADRLHLDVPAALEASRDLGSGLPVGSRNETLYV